jgi:uncharacterized protein DUF4251
MNIPPLPVKRYFLLFALLCSIRLMTQAQTTPSKQDKKAENLAMIKNLVDSQTYVFLAQTAMPMSGRTRQLTSEYDMKVTQTAIVCYLPYFGRAYTAPMDPSQGGIQFTSKDFDYKSTPRTKGGWDILIKPKDNRDIQQMSLSISSDGYASLQVTSTSKSPISFNGYIKAIPPKKSK